MKTAAVIGGVVGGVFVGALVVELLARRRSKSVLGGLQRGARRTLEAISTGFKEGYTATAKPPPAG